MVGRDDQMREEMRRRIQEVERVRSTHGKNPYQEMQNRYLSNSLLFKSPKKAVPTLQPQ